jgi:hypothetical protein
MRRRLRPSTPAATTRRATKKENHAGLRAHGPELVGDVAQYQDSYRLCYVRGPEGIIVALAEQLS